MKSPCMSAIQNLVGEVTPEDLKHIDCYVSKRLSIFIPSTGQCQYAVTPRHIHPAYSFILFLTPQTHIPVPKVPLGRDEFIFSALSPGVMHEEQPTDAFVRYMAIFIEPDLFHGVFKQYTPSDMKRFEWDTFAIHHDILAVLKEFMAESELNGPGSDEMLAALGTHITHKIVRSLLSIKSSTQKVSQRIEVDRLVEYFHQNFFLKLNLSQMAQFIGMSESNLSRVFKQETGFSPADYLIGVRLEKSKNLLRQPHLSITEVAHQCGFSSSSHFSTCFSNAFKMPPSKYRIHLNA